jgi:molybdopterin-binding protein
VKTLEAGVRNNLHGEIAEIKTDNVMAQVTM